MRILDRYLLTCFLRQLALMLAVLVGLYGLIEFIERVDDFIGNGAAFLDYLSYPLLKLPLMITQTLPMALLLAAFTTIGQLSRTQQLTALRGGGVSFWQTTRPLFACGLLLCLVMLGANGWLAPWSNREARYILAAKPGGKPAREEVSRDLYLRNSQGFLSVAKAFPERGEIRGVTLIESGANFRPQRRLEAGSAIHLDDHRWLLREVSERRFSPQGGVSGFSRQETLEVDLGYSPEELRDVWALPAELSVSELWQLTGRLGGQGRDVQRYRAELHFRLAQSLMPLIVILLGVPFALQRGRQATLGIGVALSLAVFVLYILLQAVGMALGTARLLPLPVAAWAANLLLLLIGAWLFLRTED